MTKAIEEAPSTESVLEALQARAYLRAIHLHDTVGALDDLDEVMEENPNAVAYNNRAQLQMQLGQVCFWVDGAIPPHQRC